MTSVFKAVFKAIQWRLVALSPLAMWPWSSYLVFLDSVSSDVKLGDLNRIICKFPFSSKTIFISVVYSRKRIDYPLFPGIVLTDGNIVNACFQGG